MLLERNDSITWKFYTDFFHSIPFRLNAPLHPHTKAGKMLFNIPIHFANMYTEAARHLRKEKRVQNSFLISVRWIIDHGEIMSEYTHKWATIASARELNGFLFFRRFSESLLIFFCSLKNSVQIGGLAHEFTWKSLTNKNIHTHTQIDLNTVFHHNSILSAIAWSLTRLSNV